MRLAVSTLNPTNAGRIHFLRARALRLRPRSRLFPRSRARARALNGASVVRSVQAEMVQARNDQIFEDFKKKLVEGIPLVKHCSDKQARKRIIFSDSLFTKIGWMEAGAVKSKAEPILSISEVCPNV